MSIKTSDSEEVEVFTTSQKRIAKFLAQPKFEMTKPRLLAAYWIAEGFKSYRQIAAELGVTLQTVWLWTKRPEFIGQANDYRDEIKMRVLEHGVSARERRVQIMDGVVERQVRLIQRRAEAAEADPNAEPGQETGLLTEVIQGKESVMVYDASLTRELRENLKYVSQELGQFQEKSSVAVSVETISFTIPMGPRELKTPADKRGILGPDGSVEWKQIEGPDGADPAVEGEFREVPEQGAGGSSQASASEYDDDDDFEDDGFDEDDD